MNFKEKISIHYTSLTPTEKKICTIIFDNPQIIIKNSIVEAGELCDTSKSAILRFAKKLEYRGYSEFKYAIEEYYNKFHCNQTIINENETILHQISSSYAQTIQALGLLNYEDKLRELAKLIDQYTYVKAIGIGNSAFCASQLVYSLYSHNKFFDAVVDDVQFDYLSNCLTKDYLLIIFTVSGSSTTFAKLLKAAKVAQSKVIIISMNNDSPVNHYSDMKFILPSSISNVQNKTVLNQLDNRTTLYFFSEIISYYYGIYLEHKPKDTQ